VHAEVSSFSAFLLSLVELQEIEINLETNIADTNSEIPHLIEKKVLFVIFVFLFETQEFPE